MLKEILTNPKEHQIDRYTYLVYAIHQSNPALNSLEGIKATLDKIQDPKRFFSASLVGRLEPSVAQERFGLYELINQTGTFGDIGLIIDPASDKKLRIAWNCDLASGQTEGELSEFVSEHDCKIRDPHYLLTNTVGAGGLKYNELIFNGHPDSRTTGVFYKGGAITQYKAIALAAVIGHLRKTKVPIVSLVDEERITVDRSAMTGRKLGEIMVSIDQIVQAKMNFMENEPKPPFTKLQKVF
jgi:hypothetical protein